MIDSSAAAGPVLVLVSNPVYTLSLSENDERGRQAGSTVSLVDPSYNKQRDKAKSLAEQLFVSNGLVIIGPVEWVLGTEPEGQPAAQVQPAGPGYGGWRDDC